MSSSRRILIIEKDPAAAARLAAMLSDAREYEADIASSLSDAVAFLPDAFYDMILLDLSLSDSFGIESYFAIRDQAFETPVIVLTRASDADQGADAIARGAQDHLLLEEMSSGFFLRSIDYGIMRYEVQKR